MANTASSLSANGSLTISGSFDEVTYNPTSNVRVNTLSNSQQFNLSPWGTYQATVTANVAVAPDGTTTAFSLNEDTNNGEHLLAQVRTGRDETMTASYYAKAAARTRCYISLSNYVNFSCQVHYDLIAGTITLVTGNNGDYSNISGTITPVGNGWFRCTLTATKGSVNSTNSFTIAPVVGASSVYLGTGVPAIYVWGAQYEIGTQTTPYVRTGTNAITLYSNNASKLLNISSNNSIMFTGGEIDEVTYNQNNSAPNKNVFNWSQDFSRGGWSNYNLTVTQNADIAPDGTRTATLLTGGGQYNNIRYSNGYVFVGGGGFREGETWTHSIFVKYGTQSIVSLVAEDWNFTAVNGINYNWASSFNLLTGVASGGGVPIINQGMTNVGNGWWRIWISFRVPAVVGFTAQSLQFRPGAYDGTDYTGRLTYVWGAQLERSASPTEYVGTSSPKNFLLFSEEYGRDNSNNFRWYIENISVSKATIPDPNGNFNASLISSTINGSINTCYISQQVFDVVPNVNYTYSVYLKQGTSSTSLINFYSASPFYQLTATITWPTIAGNAPTVSYAGGPVTTAVTPAPNGWYRFSMSLTNNASTSMVCRVYVRSQGVNNVIGDTVYVWGAQMEFGLAPTNYIPNGALYSATLPLAPAAMKTINTGNTFIKGTYDEFNKNITVTDGLIMYLDAAKYDSYNGTGNVWIDMSGSKNHASLNNVVYEGANDAFLMTGSATSNIACMNLSSYSALTIDAWLWFSRSVGNTGEQDLWTYNGNPAGSTMGGSFTFRATDFRTDRNGVSGRTYSGATAPRGQWFRFCYVKDGNAYINQTQYTSSGTDNPYGPLIIGQSRSDVNMPFLGKIGHIKIYNRALTLAEIDQNFTDLRSRFGV